VDWCSDNARCSIAARDIGGERWCGCKDGRRSIAGGHVERIARRKRHLRRHLPNSRGRPDGYRGRGGKHQARAARPRTARLCWRGDATHHGGAHRWAAAGERAGISGSARGDIGDDISGRRASTYATFYFHAARACGDNVVTRVRRGSGMGMQPLSIFAARNMLARNNIKRGAAPPLRCCCYRCNSFAVLPTLPGLFRSSAAKHAARGAEDT